MSDHRYNAAPSSPDAYARKKTSPVWDHFDTKAVNGKFRCLQCDEMVVAAKGNTSNLSRHLTRHHKIQNPVVPETRKMPPRAKKRGAVLPEHRSPESTSRAGKKLSTVWDHFEQEAVNGKYRCLECDKKVAAKGSNITSLAKHLDQHHSLDVSESRSMLCRAKRLSATLATKLRSSCPDVSAKPKTSPVWDYFEREAVNDKYRCLQCDLEVAAKDGNTSNLARHLDRHHNLDISNLDGATNSKRSPVWEHFEREAVNGKFRCLECDLEVAAKGNTSNLAKHLERHHNFSHAECRKRVGSATESESTQRKASLAEDSADRYNRAVAKYLAQSCQAADTVEDQQFIELLRTFDPRFKPKTRHYFARQAIPDLVKSTRAKINAVLKEVQYCAGTCDTWTNPMAETVFAFTVHFIHDFELKNACLECALFEKDHTGEEIAAWIQDVMVDWELEGKLVAITTDNGSKLCEAIDIVRTSQELLHMHCFGHSANLAARRCYEVPEVKAVLQKARKMRQLVTTSSEYKKVLDEEQAALGLDEVTLNVDCQTRWWTSLKLLKRFTEQRVVFSKALERYDKSNLQELKVSEPEAANVKAVVEILEILKETVDTLCGDEHSTASLQIPLMSNLKRLSRELAGRYQAEIPSLNDQDVDSLSLVTDRTAVAHLVELCCNLIDEELDHKFTDTDRVILEKCAFFDPRFKYLSLPPQEELKEGLLQDISEISSAFSASILPDMPEPPKKLKLSQLLTANTSSVGGEDSLEKEYNRYVNTKNLDLDEDPLKWWKANSLRFPRVSKAMLLFLCIPATSTSTKRAFSKAGRMDDDSRRAIVAKHSEELIFLSMNKDFI